MGPLPLSSGALLSPTAAAAGGGLVYRTSSDMTSQFSQWRREEGLPRTPRTPPHRRLLGPAARQAAVARRRRRTLLSRLLAAALVIAVLTSYHRMHAADDGGWEDGDGSDMPGDWDSQRSSSSSSSSPRRGAFAGLRSWLAGARGANRRSLREGPPGLDTLSLSAPGGKRTAADPGLDAAGALQFERWWFLDGFTQLRQQELDMQQQLEQQAAAAAAQGQQQLSAAFEEQRQQRLAAELASDGGGAEGEEVGTPVQRVLRLKRLQPSAFRLYDFKAKAWLRHNVTKIPVEVPVARWAVASLLNKAKKKESILFLVGGYASPHEVAASRPPKPPKTDGDGGVSLRSAGVGGAASAAAAAAAACPLASPAVYAVNTGRSKFRALPLLPEARFGGFAAVAGARLHFLGGWATPDRQARLAQPASSHWSIGLNADGSSAPEWQEEGPLPAELVGRRLTVVALADEEGEPGVYVWAEGGSDSGPAGSGEAVCYSELPPSAPSLEGGSSGGRVQLWSYAASTGWQRRGLLPQPLSDDIGCTVGASAHQLLAVGSVERSGIFTWQRGVWQYDASDAGGTWSRAGWAPAHFQGQLCALYHTRLYTSAGLPKEPLFSSEDAASGMGGGEEEAAAEAEPGGGEEGDAAAEQEQQQQQQQPAVGEEEGGGGEGGDMAANGA